MTRRIKNDRPDRPKQQVDAVLPRGLIIDAQSDEALALKLLYGCKTTDNKGLPVTKYFRPNSMRELQAREALSRRLRSLDPLSWAIREALAGLFNPDSYLTAGLKMADARKITFQERRRGNRNNLEAKLEVGEVVFADIQSGTKVESAVQNAMAKYKSSRRTVLYSLRLYRSLIS